MPRGASGRGKRVLRITRKAAGKVGLTDAVASLAEGLGDAHWWVRFRSGEALAKLGRTGRDTLVDLALRNGAEISFIDGDADLEKAGRIAALLRFRADQNTAEKKMAV